MITKRYKNIFITCFLCVVSIIPGKVFAQDEQEEVFTKGPEKGSLVIVGGGATEPIIRKFLELAGGPDAPIVVIPTAGERDIYGPNAANLNIFRNVAAENITVLHTRSRQVANSDSFTAPLLNAKGVWFGGGRQWRLVDAYKDTKTEQMFWEVLNKGGVIGGSSAGATIQGSYLARGDTRSNQIMMGDHEKGFAFIQNIAIDQHSLARNRQFDMFDILKNRPELLGISIDEKTAIIVKGNVFEVIGQSYVMIYDRSFWSREGWDKKNLPAKEKLFYFLRDGDQYDMLNRRVISIINH